MKRFKNIFRTFFVAVLAFCPGCLSSICAVDGSPLDSLEIGLITCSPHEEVYSLYGHTALRCHDLRSRDDLVFNYGVFNFQKPHFVMRFMLGQTDYELGIVPFASFCKYYKDWGCQVTEHVLDLTPEEKQRLLAALFENSMPQNRVYRYNFLYDNCSTRPRDIIERNLSGTVDYRFRDDCTPSFRRMIGDCTAGHPWVTFGIDILLGLNADFKTDGREQQFLPANLRSDFDRAVVTRGGVSRPLIKERRELIAGGIQVIEPGFPLSPLACSLVLLAVTLAVTGYEYAKKKMLRWFDVALMLVTGLSGCLLLVMFFSLHPTTSTNLQILVLNPLSLFFIPAVVRGRHTRWFILSFCFTLLFLIGGLLQHYAEGMYVLALCLLLRYWIHRNDK